MPFQLEISDANLSYFSEALLELISIQAIFDNQADRNQEEFIALNKLYDYFKAVVEKISDKEILNQLIECISDFTTEVTEDRAPLLSQLEDVKARRTGLEKEQGANQDDINAQQYYLTQFIYLNNEINTNSKATEVANQYIASLKKRLETMIVSSDRFVVSIQREDFVFIKNKIRREVAGITSFLSLCSEATVPNVNPNASKNHDHPVNAKYLKRAVARQMKSSGREKHFKQIIALPKALRAQLLNSNIALNQGQDDDNPDESATTTLPAPPPVPPLLTLPMVPKRSAPPPPAPPALDPAEFDDILKLTQTPNPSFVPQYIAQSSEATSIDAVVEEDVVVKKGLEI